MRIKRTVVSLIAFALALIVLVSCGAGGTSSAKTKTEVETDPPKQYLSDDTVIRAFAQLRYEAVIFSMSYDQLIPKLIDSYQIKVYQPDNSVTVEKARKQSGWGNMDNVYCLIVSGEVAMNPEIQYYTQHFDEAIVALLEFDETGNLLRYSVKPCDSFQTSAAILMANGY